MNTSRKNFGWLRRLVVASAFAITQLFTVAVATQATASANAWNCFPDASLTSDIYWAHQPAAVRVLRDIADDAQRGTTAIQLAQQGYVIDVPIMVYHWDPVCTMGIREVEGYTWVPSALQQPPPTVPGADLPGLPPYDPAHPPAGSIPVSLDAKDYPPVDVPPPPAVKSANVIGICYPVGADTICGVGPGGFAGKNGDFVTQGGKTYQAYVSIGLMGQTIYFKLTQ